MKHLFTILLLMTALFSFAQVPNQMNYQAVARNAQGQALANQTIKVRITLQQGTALPIPFYSETRSVTTNALGLFNVQVGSAGAQATSGSISGADWLDGNQPRSMKVELDVANNGTFVDMGSQQLVSVPYALAAKDAETAKKLQGEPPSFYVLSTTSQQLSVAQQSSLAIKHNVTHLDSHGAYNPTTGEYTIPEDGTYFFTASANVLNISAVDALIGLSIDISSSKNVRGSQAVDMINGTSVSCSYMNTLKAGDKVKVNFRVAGGGSVVLNGLGAQMASSTSFQGFKIR